jgi:phosphate transport system protein
MFRELIEALKKKPLLTQMFGEMGQMLESGLEMFRLIAAMLTGGEPLSKVTHDRVYEIDHEINHLQRNIRRQLVEHLIMSPGHDVPICLVLMSISKDAERVGDLTKNLLEVAEAQDGAFHEGPYRERLIELLAATEGLFEPTVQAFMRSDRDLAKQGLVNGQTLARRCDALLGELLKDSLSCREAVLATLMSRYLKRIALHLTNITSSVVMPLHRIDYFDEK